MADAFDQPQFDAPQVWLDRLAAGDLTARDGLVNHCDPILRKATFRILERKFPHLKRWVELDDVVQRTLLRLHQSLAQVCPTTISHLERLTLTQLRRELVDLARHYFGPEGIGAHHDPESGMRFADGRHRWERSDTTFDPESAAEWIEFHQAVEKLAHHQRDVFDRRWYRGLKFADIAAELELSERTVKRHWQQACLELRRLLYSPPE